MLLLALDTATPAVTVALHDGERVLAADDRRDTRRHGELLLPGVHRVLAEVGRAPADLTAVVAGVGPGPYTGLRVGLATAVALGSALGIPVHGLGTLDAMAYDTGRTEPFAVVTDARRREVYWARYADARTCVAGPAVERPADAAKQLADVPAVGAGATLYRNVFDPPPGGPEHASARAVAALAAERLAAGAALLPPRPLYLRRPDARVPASYKVVTPR